MFEDKTYDSIMESLKSNVPSDVSAEEGSVIYSALSPLAYELEKAYIELDNLLTQTYATTADYDYLELRAKERGLAPLAATYCQSLGVFNTEIPEGSRWSIGSLIFDAGDTYEVESGYGYIMTCETAGTTANGVLGALTPEEMPDDFDLDTIESAELTKVLIPARDKEAQDVFLQRYLDSFSTQAFGGNKADYLAKVDALDGVGGAKVYPVWAGAGTVKVAIIGSDYAPASDVLIKSVKDVLDPDDGLGGGLVPIGHVVTIVSTESVDISVSATVTAEDELTDDIKAKITEAVSNYLLDFRKTWANTDSITVRMSAIESAMLAVEGVEDVSNVKINGAASNLKLTDAQVPVLKEVVI